MRREDRKEAAEKLHAGLEVRDGEELVLRVRLVDGARPERDGRERINPCPRDGILQGESGQRRKNGAMEKRSRQLTVSGCSSSRYA
jgi:hypothetical protein